MNNNDLPAFPNNAGWGYLETKGLTKREYFVSTMCLPKEIGDYSMSFLETLVGRERPCSPPIEVIKWDAEVEAIFKIIKADALLTQLEKPQP